MTKTGPKKPMVLCVLDGWGHREQTAHNAIHLADTPNFDRMMQEDPHGLLKSWGEDVGLPEGQMGNSEVGHMNLGAGRVVPQELMRIQRALDDGTLANAPAILQLLDTLRESGGTCHLMGLVSPGGVHSHQDHMAGLAGILAGAGIPVAIHAFLDGRDTAPSSARRYMETFLTDIATLANTRIATVAGRYYPMDRDNRWDRVKLGFEAIATGDGATAPDALTAIDASYADGVTDEFMVPAVIAGYAGMSDGDGILMANFRSDRVRQLLAALLDPDFDGFARKKTASLAAAVGMIEYAETLKPFIKAVFAPEIPRNILGNLVADAGLKQLRIAETEKYPHVTFFFNGGVEQTVPGEERIMVPSPKVATYDLAPGMSASIVTDRLVEAIESDRFDFILVNFANADMVGHTGIEPAAIKAIEAVDHCLGRLRRAVETADGTLLLTADHGNADCMVDPETGEPHTQHTVGHVPVALINGPKNITAIRDGRLADVAPMVLALLGLDQPAEMTGENLLYQAADPATKDMHAQT